MTTGTAIRARAEGGEWVEGIVRLASENRRSLALLFDEGIPLRGAGLIEGKLVLLLEWSDPEQCYRTLMTGARYEVQTAGMTQWTIYDHPRDHPQHWVVREWHMAKDTGFEPAPGRMQLADSLEAARALVPPGLVCITRSPEDDPTIVETWI